MNVAILLAGGTGSRIKSSKIPKQFIEINNKPIFIYTLETFINNKNVNKIILCCNVDWISKASEYIKKYFPEKLDFIYVIEGGISRNHSILNAVKYINKNLNLKYDDIILTHDIVRMFINDEIINNNINSSILSNSIINTCIKSVDSLTITYNNIDVSGIPNRDHYLNSQTPQSGKYELIKKIYNHKFSDDTFKNTDLCKLAFILNIPIKITQGSYSNIKITNDFDLELAKFIVQNNISQK